MDPNLIEIGWILIRIQEARNDPQNREKRKNPCFEGHGCFLRDEKMATVDIKQFLVKIASDPDPV